MYRRQVSCRYCGGSGHNRSGCAKLKEYIKNNPNSYAAKVAEQKSVAAKHRRCSYCNNEGHTRRTCSHVMNDMVQVAVINIDFRKKALETIKRVGLAPGALISVREVSGYDQNNNYVYDKRDQLALVTGLDMEQIRSPNDDRGCQFVRVQFMGMYQYGGNRLAESILHVPNWFLLVRKNQSYEVDTGMIICFSRLFLPDTMLWKVKRNGPKTRIVLKPFVTVLVLMRR